MSSGEPIKLIPNPGSKEAGEQGCTCPVMDNWHGDPELGRIRGFVMVEGCPLHWTTTNPQPTQRKVSRMSKTTERWQIQTLAGGLDVPAELRGDCFRACVASILNVPLNTLPNPHGMWEEGWADALEPLGYEMVKLDIERLYPHGLWIAQLPSLNLPACLHVVVMRGGDLVHDPAMTKRYTDSETLWNAGRGSISGGYKLAALDPATPQTEEDHD